MPRIATLRESRSGKVNRPRDSRNQTLSGFRTRTADTIRNRTQDFQLRIANRGHKVAVSDGRESGKNLRAGAQNQPSQGRSRIMKHECAIRVFGRRNERAYATNRRFRLISQKSMKSSPRTKKASKPRTHNAFFKNPVHSWRNEKSKLREVESEKSKARREKEIQSQCAHIRAMVPNPYDFI